MHRLAAGRVLIAARRLESPIFMKEEPMHKPLAHSLSRRTVLQGSMAAGLAGLFAQHASAQEATPETAENPISSSGDFAGLVDIGSGRKLYMECRGSGSPNRRP